MPFAQTRGNTISSIGASQGDQRITLDEFSAAVPLLERWGSTDGRPPFRVGDAKAEFAKIDAEKSPFLTERLKIWMLPTLALISKEKVLDYIVGFDDLGGSDDFPTEHLRLVLASKNMINYHGDDAEADARRSAYQKTTEVVEKPNLRKGGGNLVLGSDDEDSDFD